MKKSTFMFITLILSLFFSNVNAMTIEEIMSKQFGLREYEISIYDEITVKNKASKEDELRVTQEWKDVLLKRLDPKKLSKEQTTKICKELISVCMVGMFYANKYFGSEKDKEQFDKYLNIFMYPLYFATHILGAIKDLDDKSQKEILEKIYMPLLRELAVYEKQMNESHRK